MKKLLFLLLASFDGDQYQFFNEEDLEKATEAFNTGKEQSGSIGMWNSVTLMKVEPGTFFGTGSRGDLFGAEILLEYNVDDEDDGESDDHGNSVAEAMGR